MVMGSFFLHVNTIGLDRSKFICFIKIVTCMHHRVTIYFYGESNLGSTLDRQPAKEGDN